MRTHARSWIAVYLTLAAFGSIGATSLEAQGGSEAQKAILVTGASTGIGRAIAEMLASDGYFVYAGARKDRDLRELDAIENIQSIRLDVTKQDEIDAAVQTVTDAGRGLYGLVNNAGVAVLGPMIEVTEEDLDFQFDVNVFGPYRITKAFAPLIIEAEGRITTTGSISGILSGGMAGPYSMSKHAVEAYTDALAAEMARFGVKVSVVEPGRFQSNMSANVLSRMEEMNQSPEGSLFEADMRGMIQYASGDESQYKEPTEVAEAVMRALFDDDPVIRYMVAPTEQSARGTIMGAMAKVIQLNDGQASPFDRETLLEMFETVLAR